MATIKAVWIHEFGDATVITTAVRDDIEYVRSLGARG